MAIEIRHTDHVAPLYPQKLALTSLTSGGCSVGIVHPRTQATELGNAMDQLLIPVGHCALFLPSLNWSWGDYYLESLFGIYPPGKFN
jgi:hypothetical protein